MKAKQSRNENQTYNYGNIEEHEFNKDSSKLITTTQRNMNLTRIYQRNYKSTNKYKFNKDSSTVIIST